MFGIEGSRIVGTVIQYACSGLEFSKRESWSRDPSFTVSVLVLKLRVLVLGLAKLVMVKK